MTSVDQPYIPEYDGPELPDLPTIGQAAEQQTPGFELPPIPTEAVIAPPAPPAAPEVPAVPDFLLPPVPADAVIAPQVPDLPPIPAEAVIAPPAPDLELPPIPADAVIAPAAPVVTPAVPAIPDLPPIPVDAVIAPPAPPVAPDLELPPIPADAVIASPAAETAPVAELEEPVAEELVELTVSVPAPPVDLPPVPETVTDPVVEAPAAAPVVDPFEQAPEGSPMPVISVPDTPDQTRLGALPVTADTTRRPRLERLLTGLVVGNGSDMHIAGGEIPRYRISGSLIPVAGEPIMTSDYLEELLEEALNPRAWAEFKEHGDLDTAYAMSEAEGAAITCRFRVNVYRSMGQTGTVIRVIPTNIVPIDALGVPPQVKNWGKLPRGLVLVCGPTGSGKSTTLAGLIDYINETREERIFTFEDPIEFTHFSKKCLVSHREIGEDTPSFAEGLRRVRREDPDIILIGEMRDYETIDAAIEAADTGHLVFGTLHTNSAPETISRIINSFPAERQEQVKVTLASVLKGVLCQTLVPSPTAPRGRVVACEIMMVNPAISNMIRQNQIPQIANALTDTTEGSLHLDAHLAELVRNKQITRRSAEEKASSPESLARFLG